MIAGRIKHLEKEHAKFEKEIETLERTGKFTDVQLHDLKKKKLAVRDELSRLRKEEYEDRQSLDFDDDHR